MGTVDTAALKIYYQKDLLPLIRTILKIKIKNTNTNKQTKCKRLKLKKKKFYSNSAFMEFTAVSAPSATASDRWYSVHSAKTPNLRAAER